MQQQLQTQLTLDQLYLQQSKIQVDTSERRSVTLDQFSLLKVIGKGSFAKVVQVRKKDNQKIYALKVLKKAKLESRSLVRRLYSEKNILLQCSHPFIVKLEYAFQNTSKLYYCLEYCPGGELYNLLCQKHKLTEDQTRFYAAQILMAIEYLHERDIVYRDLKPENVLIDQDGYLKITDFGLSKEGIKGNTGVHSKCGTAEYLAPEILEGNHGKAVDWWAFGTIIYEMIVGRSPFEAESREKLIEQILNQQLNLKKQNMSPELKDLLSKLLTKDQTQRLGYKGSQDIKQHKWFKHVEWDELYRKQVKPFFIPELDSDDDVKYFDEVFLNEPITPQDDIIYGENYYQNFSYNGQESL